MPEFVKITSKDNQLIKFVSLLQTSSKQRTQHGLFVLEGLRICMDAYDNNIKFDKLIVAESALEKYNENINLFSNISDDCYLLSDGLFISLQYLFGNLSLYPIPFLAMT